MTFAGGGWPRFEFVTELLFQRLEFACRRSTTDNRIRRF